MQLIRKILFPFAIIYDAITTLRNVLFDVGILKSTHFEIPVIVVGNLSVGGTGKTPQIEYLIRLLKNNQKTAVLSRGYKRKTIGFILANSQTKVAEIGDEPFQYFSKFNDLEVAVDEDRVHGIQQLLAIENPPQVVLLDDAFQHRKVQSDFNILLTPYHDLYVDDLMLPSGNLRESRRGAKRAKVVIVTKCPNEISTSEKREIQNKLQLNKDQQLFFTAIIYSNTIDGSLGKQALEDLKGAHVLLITGIVNPQPMVDFLHEKGFGLTHIKYADHHNFSDKEIETIERQFDTIESEKKIILTTEKDYMRLKNRLTLSYLEIEIAFLEDEKYI